MRLEVCIYGISFEMGYSLSLHFSLELNMELPTGPTGVASSTAEQVRAIM